MLEKELLVKELEKQKAINRTTVDTQERERGEIGRELHDNVNQVLWWMEFMISPMDLFAFFLSPG